MFNNLVANLADNLDNTTFINLRPNTASTAIKVVNNGADGWNMYDYKGNIVISSLDDVWDETVKIIGSSLNRVDDPNTADIDESTLPITNIDIENYFRQN